MFLYYSVFINLFSGKQFQSFLEATNPLRLEYWLKTKHTYYSRGLYFRVNSREHTDAKIKSSLIISNVWVTEEDMKIRENKVS